MKKKISALSLCIALAAMGIGLFTSCIREELPGINVDVTDMQPTVQGTGIVKTTIQENGVTIYADMRLADITNLNISVSVSRGATYSFVDVKMDTTFIEYGGQKLYVAGQCPIKATVTGKTANPKDYSKTRYIKVVCEAEGVNEDDTLTQHTITSQLTSGLIGWEKDGVQSQTYTPGAHLYKIWSVNVLPAGIPTNLGFNNWSSVIGSDYQLPYETLIDDTGKALRSDVWASTNASIALMAKTMPLVFYGARATTDVATNDPANTHALLLTSNDIRYTKTYPRPFLAGCCFIGAFDGSDTGALTCTHVGLPFNKVPEELTFYYKYLPMTIHDPNDQPDLFGTGFNVSGISEYVGKQDKGFIRAVLFRNDGSNKWLDGASIRDASNEDVIAYAEFAPESQSAYKQQTVKFTYVKDVNADDLKNWKYSLAIYFASSYDGFRFICGADMSSQLTRLYTGGKLVDLLKEQMGSQLYIDEMEIKCKK